jgi:hypothetical protein
MEHSIHKKRLSRISSRINNQSPKRMKHVAENSKGRYLELSKKNLIQTSNRILVDKLLKVTSRENSVQRPRKNTAPPNRLKKLQEIVRITNENFRILNKIKTSRPYYSCEKMRKDYDFKKNLKKMISQNAGRVPKILNFTQVVFENGLDATRSVKNLKMTYGPGSDLEYIEYNDC